MDVLYQLVYGNDAVYKQSYAIIFDKQPQPLSLNMFGD